MLFCLKGCHMEHLIAKLLEDFEHGKMTRLQLIQSLPEVSVANA